MRTRLMSLLSLSAVLCCAAPALAAPPLEHTDQILLKASPVDLNAAPALYTSAQSLPQVTPVAVIQAAPVELPEAPAEPTGIFALILAALTAIATGAVWAYRTFSKATEEEKRYRLQLVGDFAHLGYMAVKEWARLNPNSSALQKVTLGFEKVDKALAAANQSPLTLAERDKVQMIFDANHAAEKLSPAFVNNYAVAAVPK